MRFLIVTLLFLFLAGCALVGGEEMATVSFRHMDTTGLGDAVRVSFHGDGKPQTLAGTNLGGRPPAHRYEVYPGTLEFTASLYETGGTIQLPVRAGWHYDVMLSVGSQNPYAMCFGCTGVQSFSLASVDGFEATDSLFVVWAASDPENPVMY